MHTIWFYNSESRYEQITVHNIPDAQRVWDSLAIAGFQMRSLRP